jgi:dephospho-CoA kinase
MVIGVTGGYCSGKNTAARLLVERGFALIDVDALGHRALEAKTDEVAARFGGDVLIDGRVDRKVLGRIVFSDGQAKADLERIVHPWMVRRVRALVGETGRSVINAALLIEMCLHVLCDLVIGIETERDRAIQRAQRRDGLSRADAASRLDSQIPVKAKLHLVDILIENNGTLNSFERRVAKVLDSLSSKDF